MPLLHLWQEQFGFISDEGVRWIAAKLELQPINILELVTFYPMFRAGAGRQETHSRLPHVELRDGRQLSSDGETVRRCRNRSPSRRQQWHAQSDLGQRGRKIQHRVRRMPRQLRHRAGLHGAMMTASRTCRVGTATQHSCPTTNRRSPIAPPPHPLEHRLIFKNIGREDWTTDIDCYLRDGGYEQLKKAVTMSRTDIVNEVKTSGLRGRGGAGFPCGVKWSFIKPDEKKPVYLICNADESEPGTFKDRYIIHQDPHQLIEGMLISCFALNAQHGLHLHSRRVSRRREDSGTRDRGSARAEFPRARTFSAPASTSRSTSIAAPAPTSAAKKPA